MPGLALITSLNRCLDMANASSPGSPGSWPCVPVEDRCRSQLPTCIQPFHSSVCCRLSSDATLHLAVDVQPATTTSVKKMNANLQQHRCGTSLLSGRFDCAKAPAAKRPPDEAQDTWLAECRC